MDLTSGGTARRLLAGVAVAATAPYLTLKLLWLSGSTVGVVGAGFTDDSTLWVLNLLTFAMDAVAVALALAFVRPWGRRLPAALPVFPMWVATGLLATLIAALALTLGADALLGPEPSHGQQAWLRPWVYALVYGGFAVQGVTLLAGFALYARERWAALLRERTGGLPRTSTLPLQRVLACAAAVLAAPAVGLHLLWSVGGTLGLAAGTAAEAGRGLRLTQGVSGLAAAVACAAALALAFRWRPERRLAPLLATGWVAGGSMFAWGAWIFLADAVSAGAGAERTVPAATLLADAAQVAGGLLLLVIGALTLVEHASARADIESAG
ncbi:hypothetical protein [Kitasatospora cinereorecta]|uniref:LigA protein n=1 Tax=Kitasatospora cinereorecta TaxID=285560 RepID=A0ABW0VFR5_9ACTN